jgi:NADP-reducing hydrogenase subunit HndD
MGAAAPPPLVRLDRRREPRARVALEIDGREVSVPEGTTILGAARTLGIEIPTLCFLETLRPVNVCRICVVELEGARVLVPACSRQVEAGMRVKTRSPRVDLSRKLVLEMLASSVDLSTAGEDVPRWIGEYGAQPGRFGKPAPAAPAGARDALTPGHHAAPDPAFAATVAQPAKIDNELYVRDYGKCILCYKCVEACGPDHQNTFAIALAGRGFDARISTEFATPLPDSACVYCGNCIAVCPTGALMSKREYDARAAGEWREEQQSTVDTICPYCGVGCTLTLHVQDGEIMKATSPLENPITLGNLCIKGRFGWRFVHGGQPEPERGAAAPRPGKSKRKGNGKKA